MTHDPATLDQLRVLIAIAETGSFSAAGRKLNRVQSAISHAVGAMEDQFGTLLFDRSAGRPTLTPAGESVLAVARDVCARADALRRLAEALGRGEEPILAVAIEVLYPTAALAAACREFAVAWPAVQLRLNIDTLGAVAERVRDGSSVFGIVGPAADTRDLHSRYLGEVQLVTVVASSHPLGSEPGPLPVARVAEEVQIVLSERAAQDETPDQGVLSTRTWRVHDLQTKRALILDGLGWGNLPLSAVEDDLATNRLRRIHLESWPPDGVRLPLMTVTRSDTVLGPAGSWLLTRLEQACGVRPDTPSMK